MTRVDDGTHQAHTELTWWPPKQNRAGPRCFEAFFHPPSPSLPLHHLPPSSPLHLHRVNIFLCFLSSPLSCSPCPPTVSAAPLSTHAPPQHISKVDRLIFNYKLFSFMWQKNTKHNLLNSRRSLTLNSRIYPDSSL